jgi:hypothetical protein
LRDQLFRNDLVVNADGSRMLHLMNVAAASGIDVRTDGMGVATSDFDTDGFVDIYRTRFGAAWFDFDNDAALDLLVVNGSITRIEAQAGTRP